MLSLILALLTPAHAQCSDKTTLSQSTSGSTVEAYDRFGGALAVGDFDNDGYLDLAVGSPEEDLGSAVNAGYVTIHYGGSGGLGASSHGWSQSSIDGTSNETGDKLGYALTVGDFDGDGYDDLFMGLPYEDQGSTVDAGRVAVKYGGPSGLPASADSSSWSQNSLAGNGADTGDLLGFAVAAGDFDGDGYDDVAIGSPEDNVGSATGTGKVIIMYGSSTGLSSGNSEAMNQNGITGMTNESGDDFGFALAAGDYNGDGKDDLAIGVPRESRNGLDRVGQIAIKNGHSSGLKAGGSSRFGHPFILATDKDTDFLGEELASGDIDGDGIDDLIVGVPAKDVGSGSSEDWNAGIVGVAYGGSSGLVNNADTRVLTSAVAGISVQSGVNFGGAVSAGDLDGDGYDDVVVGVPRYSGSQGRIAVFFGNSTGTLATNTQWFSEVCMGGSAVDDQYFASVLAVGDFDGDGDSELAAGDPNHTVSSNALAGRVYTAEISK